ncbi:MAG: ABC transporter ATP-binding protein [Flavobacteriales bacterium]
MEVNLRSVRKSFGREIVLLGIDHTLSSGSRTALLGPNGSGKSTLLQLIAGAMLPTEGTVVHRMAGREVAVDEVYRKVSIAAPYLGLYEELSLRQMIDLHKRVKPLRNGLDTVAVARSARLEHALDKPLTQYSSGMKQRAKLAIAILSDTPLLLLDEPTSNLDADGVQWYMQLLEAHVAGRTLVVASNAQQQEFALCDERIEVMRYKPASRVGAQRTDTTRPS